MRYLSSALLEAQKQSQVQPMVRLIVRDYQALDVRLDWSPLYSGSEPQGPNCAIQAADGSLVRTRVDPSNGNLYRQRVTDPTQTSQWTSWTYVKGVSQSAQVALAADRADASVFLFFVDPDNRTIKVMESSDYGASFSGEVQVVQEGSGAQVKALAGEVQTGGEPILFYGVDPAGGGADSVVKVVKRSGGSWGSPSTWDKGGKYLIQALAVVRERDYEMLLTGRDNTQGYPWRLWSVVYGDGVDVAAGTWSALNVLEKADADLPFQYSYPTIRYLDLYRAAFVGSYTGSGGYERLHLMRTAQGSDFISSYWTEPAPFNLSPSYGAALAYDSPSQYIYLIGANFAQRAPVSGAASVDLSSRVVRYRATDGWGEDGAVIELDNSDGALTNIGQGSYVAVHRGALVELSPGYVTSEGPKYRQRPSLWIGDHEFVVREGTSRLILYCIGGWGVLGSWRASRQYHWTAGSKNVFQIASRILGFLGLDLSTAGEASSDLSNFYPSFTIHPGEDGRGALLRLLAKVPDYLYWDLGVAYAKEFSVSESSDYSYGGAGEHIILEGRYGSRAFDFNHLEVFGASSSFAEAVDFSQIGVVGHRLRKVFDYAYDTNNECVSRAAADLRYQEVRGKWGQIVIYPNVGQELFDVIAITDSRVGLSSALRRVMGIREEYDAEKGVYRQILELGDR